MLNNSKEVVDKEKHNIETVLSNLNEYNKLANEINNAIENYMSNRARK